MEARSTDEQLRQEIVADGVVQKMRWVYATSEVRYSVPRVRETRSWTYPSPFRGSRGALLAPPVGYGVQPQQKTGLVHFYLEKPMPTKCTKEIHILLTYLLFSIATASYLCF